MNNLKNGFRSDAGRYLIQEPMRTLISRESQVLDTPHTMNATTPEQTNIVVRGIPLDQ